MFLAVITGHIRCKCRFFAMLSKILCVYVVSIRKMGFKKQVMDVVAGVSFYRGNDLVRL